MEVNDKFNKVKYNNSFNKESYDRFSLMLQKGEKVKISEHAKNHGESINAFINRAIHETMERDNFSRTENFNIPED